MTTTFVELLRNRALSHPDKTAFTFLLDGEKKRVSLTYAQLDQKARTIAAHLQTLDAKGERALLLYPPGLEFVASFLGCLYAGVVAVPAYPPRRNRPDPRIVAMVEDGQIAFSLVSETFLGLLDKSAQHIPVLKDMHMIATDTLSSSLSEQWIEPEIEEDTLAFLQYTSGSTADPKGVMVSHRNLLHNEAMMQEAYGTSEDDVMISWLPLYHDMGLIGKVLLPLYSGAHCVFMAPMSFLEKPLRWLQAISEFKGTFLAAPNFAYDLCVRKITDEEKVDLDLSHLRIAVNAAEPIRSETLKRFAQAFEQNGFRSNAFQPSYGLAETTLFVTGSDMKSLPKTTTFDKGFLEQDRGQEADSGSEHVTDLVAHGSADFGQKVLTVHPELHQMCAEGEVGEIWVSGGSIAVGYWNRPEATTQIFEAKVTGHPEKFLRTGDLGFFHKGELYITGRIKDLIIVRGRNHYPQDLEQVAELAHPDLHLGGCAAFNLEGASEEELALVIEAKNRTDLDTAAVCGAIRQAISEQFDLTVHTIALIRRGTLPKTSSGKVQRRATKQALLDEKLKMISSQTLSPEEREADQNWMDQSNLPRFLQGVMSQILKRPQSEIQVECPLTQYGLNSMMVIESQYQLQEHLGVQVPLSLFFEGASIEKLSICIQDLLEQNPNRALTLPKIQGTFEQQYETFPLTDIQQAYLIGRQGGLELGNIGTHIYREFPFKQLDVALLQKVWNRLIQRHGMLRMVANHDGTQRVLPEVPEYQIKTTDLSNHSPEDHHGHMGEVREQMSHQVFSGTQWPSFELRVSQFADSSYVLHMSIDILGLDASSLMLVFQELVTLYDNPDGALSELNITFRDYVLAEEKLRQTEIYQTAQTYWHNRATNFPMAPELPFAKDPSAIKSPHFERRFHTLKREEWEQLQKTAQRLQITPTVLLTGCFAETLKAWSKNEHFALNLTLFNRLPLHEQINNILGDFTSLTLLEVDFKRENGFSENLKQLQAQLLEDLDHKYYSGVEFQRSLSQVHGKNITMPIVVTSMLGLALEQPKDSTLSLPLAEDGQHYNISQTPQVTLDFQIIETAPGELSYNWDSVEGLFPKDLLDTMFVAFQQLLEKLATDEKAWEQTTFDLLPQSQIQLMETFNATQQELPSMLLHTPILEQVRQRPAHTAVVCHDKSLSYAELGHRALDLADKLRLSGVQPNQLVAVLMEKGWEQIVAVLGILQAGAAYLPIDASLPDERIHTLLKIGEVKDVVTVHSIKENFAFAPGLTIWSADDEPSPERSDLTLMELMSPQQSIDDIAYVIFTSGSTGTPKGVVIDHRGANNTIQDINQRFRVTSEDRMLGLSNLSFDLSVYDVFGVLGVGGTLVLPQPEENRDPEAWQQLIRKERVTLWNTVPVLMQMLVDHSEQQNLPLDLRLILMSGDWIPTDLPDRIRALNSQDAEIISLGGATEASIWSIFHPIGAVDPSWASIPYGQPLANQEFYVLKPDLSPVPIGVSGDLYIGGVGLALEYWRDEEKTRNSFVVHPSDAKKRLYKTGDMGVLHANGLIEFLGREDSQVKVQGHRIELGEIESRLREHKHVQDAVAHVIEEGRSKRLVGYIVGEDFQESDIQSFLAKTLPTYMVPNIYVSIAAVPLTANGKVDRKALVVPHVSDNSTQTHVSPRSSLEVQLQEIWQKLLDGEDIQRLGIHDNFFEVGGNSLLAVQMAGQLQKVLNKQVSIQSIFEHPSIAQLSTHLQSMDNLGTKTIPQVNRSQPTLMSFAQQRLWILDQLEGPSVTYNLSAVMKIEGTLNAEALEKSVVHLIARHETLRTIFKLAEGQRVQVVLPEAQSGFSLIQHDLRHLSEEDQKQQVHDFIETEHQTPFDLSQGPLIRMAMIQLQERAYRLLFSMHHIMSDGRSLRIFMEELSQAYQAELRGKSPLLPELPIQYVDYSEWQQEQLSTKLKGQEQYWVNQLKDLPPFLELPTDHSRPAVQTFKGRSESFDLSDAVVEGLRLLTQQHGGTVFMTLLGAFQVFLAKYSNMSDIAIGTLMANRNHPDVEGLIGFFVNTLVLRSHVDGALSFEDFMLQVKGTTLDAFENQDIPFNHLVDVLRPQRNLSHSPLFQVMFSWQDETLFHSDGRDFKFPGTTLEVLPQENQVSKFDLTLGMSESKTGISGHLEYNTDLFERVTIQRMLEHFQVLLQNIIQAPQTPIQALSLLSHAERQHVLVEWNETAHDFPKDRCIHELFEVQVEKTPNQIALIEGTQTLSYRELNAKANQLAHCLINHGVQPDALVGLCLDHSLNMVIALWGILKAGGAYVPLDPSLPQKRLEQMLEDGQLKYVVTQQALAEQKPFEHQSVFCLDDSRFQDQLEHCPTTNLVKEDLGLTSHHLAYMIYTSGSTGQPKGVMIEHQALVNRICWMDREYGLSADDVVLQKTSFSFDVSVWEFTWPMITGARLVIAQTEGRKDPRYLAEQIVKHQVTTLHFVPVMLKAMVLDRQWTHCSSVRQVFCSGEALPHELQTQFFATGTPSELHNLYGPTEAAIDVSFWKCSPDSKRKTVPIGRPIQNTQLYALDKQGNPVPSGVIGELHIGGVGLARGYKNRPALTEEKFIVNPFSADPGSRLYKTGDLVSLRSGQLEFLGRVDHQVKIRGFRIELGEIEHNLCSHPFIESALVMLRGKTQEEQQLVAYLIPRSAIGNETELFETMKSHLKEQLPTYMVPQSFVLLEVFPLNSSGKIDRKALPEPDFLGQGTSVYQAPQTATELSLSRIWQDVLKLERKDGQPLGIHEDFFEVGGNSILAVQLANQMEKAMSKTLSIRSIFEHPSIAQLSEQLERSTEGMGTAIPQRDCTQPALMSFAQQRLWFLDQLEGPSVTYNIPAVLQMEGTLNVEAFQTCVNRVIARHETLRTVFKTIDGQPIQVILPASETQLLLTQHDLSHLPEDQQTEQVQQWLQKEEQTPFDLSNGPLIRMSLLHLKAFSNSSNGVNAQHYLLLVNMHHIISDARSIEIFTQELSQFYQAEIQGEKATLPALPIQYVDFSQWQHGQLSQKFKEQEEYWVHQLKDLPPFLELPTDHPRPAIQTFGGQAESFVLAPEVAEGLTRLTQQSGGTLFMTLLGAFQVFLAKYSNMSDIAIGSVIANRNYPEVEGLVGFFANTLVLRSQVAGDLSFEAFMTQVKNTTLDAFENQDLPFNHLVDVLSPQRSMSHSPLFQVMFAWKDDSIFRNHEQSLNFPGVQLNVLEQDNPIAKFDLTLEMLESESVVSGQLEYNTDLFERSTIQRMLEHFQVLLQNIVKAPQAPIQELSLLSLEEQDQLRVQWNDTADDFPKECCVHELFEKQVSSNPHATALTFENETLSYEELNQRANQVAHYLVEQGVQPDDVIALCLERSLNMIVALLGILKAGGAYIPLDPRVPQARLEYTIADSGAQWLVTQSDLKERLSHQVSHWLCMDHCELLENYPKSNLKKEQLHLSSSHLAYVIYTSGSTGKPKGSLLEHSGLCNLAQALRQELAIGPDSKVLQFASIAFDAATSNWVMALTSGAELCLISQEVVQSPSLLDQLVEKHSITHALLPPALLPVLTMECWSSVQCLISGGDVCSQKLAEKWAVDRTFYNAYGPSEVTVISNMAPYEVGQSQMHMGQPLMNTQAYVLDEHQQLVPIGVTGELYIGGAGLSRSYLNRPELTQEKFISVQFPTAPEPQRLYRTGDLVRWLPTQNGSTLEGEPGNLQFVGRVDHQVKIRGFRIELGEIEHNLSSHASVASALVLLMGNTEEEQQLVAYLLPQHDVPNEIELSETLKSHLKQHLPGYMIPRSFVFLEEFPMNSNGKIERKALPKPEFVRGSSSFYQAPQSPTELSLSQIWQDVLNGERTHGSPLGVHDDFFEVGGNSILAVQLVHQIQKVLNKAIPLRTILSDPTIQRMAKELDQQDHQQLALPSLESNLEQKHDPFPLNDIQQAYLLGRDSRFELGNVGTHVYIEIPFKTFDVDAFQKAWNHLIQRHDMMRMVALNEGEQQILSNVPEYQINVLELSAQAEVAQFQLHQVRDEMSHRVFSGKEWPLFDLRLSQKSDGPCVLHSSLDGLSMDASSMMLIIHEAIALYGDPQHVLPELEVNFRDYVLAEQKMRRTEIYQVSQAYWEQRLATFPSAPELPLALDPSQIGTPRFERRLGHLDKPRWKQLQKSAQKSQVTPTIFLLGCFSEVLKSWTKQAHFTLNLTLFNRIPLHEQINQIVGDFTSLTLLEVDFSEDQQCFSGKLKNLQNQLWHDLEHKYFGGLEVLRALAKAQGQAVAMPIVVTSTLGLSLEEDQSSSFLTSIADDEEIYSISQTPQVWLDFQIKENAKGELEYNWDSVEGLFPKDLLDTMFGAFQQLIEGLATDEKAWDKTSFALLPEAQIQLMERFNATQQELPSMLLHTPILEQIHQRPEQTAVVCHDKSLSYAELGHRAFELADQLKQSGVLPNQLVAVLMEKGWEQVVAVLGILQAGAAYLPIDASLPEERIHTLLEIGEVQNVVTVQAIKESFAFAPGLTIWSVDDEPSAKSTDPALLKSMPPQQSMNDIAYVIFTSGSTGTPKGVVIDHRGANNTIQDINQRFQVTSEDRMLGLSNLSFDLSVYDVFGILGAGGTMVLPQPEENRDPEAWQHLLQKEKITLWNTVPVLMQMLVDHSEQQNLSLDLRLILMSGDWIPTDLPDRIRALSTQETEIISLGGATEASIWSIYHPIEMVDPNWSSIPYGRPLANQEFYVLKPDLSLAPLGVPGDLYIGGVGLALEYWRDEEKTRNSFVIDPARNGKRLYKTGDMGRMHPNGRIEFLGREDSQVKVQGHRIELGEIESRLREHEHVLDAVVHVIEEGHSKRLVGYIVSEAMADHADQSASLSTLLQTFLSKTLPSYMVPHTFMSIEKVPLTGNGKVNRKALPLPEVSESSLQGQVAPRTPVEGQLHGIWQELLETEDTDGIGIHDNFFELGGNSLMAVQMTGKIQSTFNKTISIQSIFEHASIAQLSEQLESLDEVVVAAIPQRDRTQPTIMSFAQQRLWFLDQLEGPSVTYNIPGVLQMEGTLNVEAFEKSVNLVIERHETLRTVFKTVEGQPIQVILPAEQSSLSLTQHDLSHLSEEQSTEQVQQFLKTEAQTPFDLSKGPLIRMSLLHLKAAPSSKKEANAQQYLLFFSMHHIISDARSIEIFTQELSQFYQAEIQGEQNTLPELPIQYVDFSQWQHRQLSKKFKEQEEYWVHQLKDLPPFLELPTDHPRPAVQSFGGDSESFVLPQEVATGLQQVTQQFGGTLFMTLLGAFQVFLAKYSNMSDIAIGSVIANRNYPEVEGLVGFFANTLVLRSQVDGGLSFEEFMTQVKDTTLKAYQHQDLPFNHLVDVLSPQRSMSHSPLFQVMFAWKDDAVFRSQGQNLNFPGVELTNMEQESHISKFDLTMDMFESETGILGRLEYNTDLFERSTIQRMLEHFQVLLQNIVKAPQTPIQALSLLSHTEKQQLLVEWNDTASDFPKECCIQELFEAQVEKAPQRIALIEGGQRLSYGELNAKANQLAHCLIAYGVKPDSLVGLCIDHSIDMVIALWGILKAGGAYVPLDPSLPKKRLEQMLDDAQLKYIVTHEALIEERPFETQMLFCLDDPRFQEKLSNFPSINRNKSNFGLTSKHLAYMIYTSGSTGQPKGVMIEHQALVNRICWMNQEYGLTPKDVVLQKTSFSFDVSVWEFTWPMITGAALVIAQTEGRKDPRYLAEQIVEHQVTTLHFVPVMLKAMLLDRQWTRCSSVRQVFCSGEALPYELQSQFFATGTQSELHNLYGPTEAAIDVSFWKCLPDSALKTVPIGRPIHNTQLYVLDPQGNPAPSGVVGELHIGGIGLARGYKNRPELTEEKFIANPFSTDPNSRLYKTGDLVSLRSGQLEFLGRVDHQVKVRGFRIELGEIEHNLCNHPSVDSALVLLRGQAQEEQQLVAYLISKGTVDTGKEFFDALKSHLKEQLPAYMVPQSFVLLDAFPLNSSGKIDRKALPEPDFLEQGASCYQAPQSATEWSLSLIWQNLLKIERSDGQPLGIHEDFFEVGGNSILAVELVHQIGKVLNKTIPLRTILSHPTIQGMASDLDHGVYQQLALPTLEKNDEAKHDPFPMNDIQRAYWLGRDGSFELGNVGTHIYSEIPLTTFDIHRFQQAWNRLIQRHDMLRMVVLDGGNQQILADVPDYQIKVLNLSDHSEEAQAQLLEIRNEMSHHVFSGKEWPMFDFRWSQKSNGHGILHSSLDALFMDGASLALMTQEMLMLYDNPQQDFAELEVNFRDYVLAEQKMRTMEIYRISQAYWEQRLETFPSAPELPFALDPSQIETPRFERRSGQLDKAKWMQIQKKAQSLHVTPTVLVLGAFSEVLKNWSKQAHFTLNLTLFNRIPLHEQIDQIVGDFTSLTLLEVDFREAKHSFSEKLARLQNQLWHDLEHKYFGGLEMLRALAKAQGQAVAMPIVVTSTLGLSWKENQPSSLLASIANDEEPYSISQTPQVWLDFQIAENAKGELSYNWDSVEGLFPEDMLNDMFAAFEQLLDQHLQDDAAWKQSIPSLLPSTHHALIARVNDAQQDFPSPLLHTLLLEQIEQKPGKIAVYSHRHSLTYQELGQRSLELSQALKQAGAQPNQLIAVVMEKGWEQIVAVLAILRSGAAYLPIDARLPAQRIQTLLEIGEVQQVVCTPAVQQSLNLADPFQVWTIDDAHFSTPENEVQRETPIQSKSDLAYVIFTSGSTGVPKGVMIDHQGAMNTLLDVNQRFKVTEHDQVLGLSSLSFDLSVFDIFGVLGVGGTLVLPEPDEYRDPEAWLHYLEEREITIWNTVPALMGMLVEQAESLDRILDLRLVMMSGDWIPVDLPNRIHTLSPDPVDIISLGGATEVSIWSVFYPIETVESHWKSIPYGRALSNQSLYVLKEDLSPAPIWSPGDLYIGGKGLALGYWKDPDKTAKSFVTSSQTGEPLYKTGDLARLLPSGELEFLGREDSQVKIRGHRIELGEIEANLREHEAVDEVIVIPFEESPRNKTLVAYVSWNKERTLSPAGSSPHALHNFLAERLPQYMIPATFMDVERFPLTSNGKIDRAALSRKSLPRPVTSPASTQEIVIARTPEEKLLASLWQDVLKTGEVDVRENIFDVGATSLSVVTLMAQLLKRTGQKIALRAIYENPTIEELAKVLEKTSSPEEPEAAKSTDAFPVIPSHHWFLNLAAEGLSNQELSHWTVAMTLNIPSTDYDRQHFETIMRVLFEHHECFRLKTRKIDGQWMSSITPPEEKIVTLHEEDFSNLSKHEEQARFDALCAEAFQKPNLAEKPYHAVALNRGKTEGVLLLFMVHHLFIDEFSGAILHDDMNLLMEQLRNGETPQLTQATDSVRDISKKAFEYAHSEAGQQALDAIMQVPWDSVPVIPYDFPQNMGDKTKNTALSERHIMATLSVEETELLRTQVLRKYGVSFQDLVIAFMMRAFHLWSGNDQLLANVYHHGRGNLEDVNLSRTVCYLVDMYRCLFELPIHENPKVFLESFKEQFEEYKNLTETITLFNQREDNPIATLPQAEIEINATPEQEGEFESKDCDVPGAARLEKIKHDIWQNPKMNRVFSFYVEGSIRNNQVDVEIRYSNNLHKKSSVETIRRFFLEGLRSLIQ